MEPRWTRGMRGDSYTKGGPVPYSFSALYLEYYCNSSLKKINLGDETYVWHYVFVNHYNWFCDRIGDWDYKGDGKKIMIFYCHLKWVPGRVGHCMLPPFLLTAAQWSWGIMENCHGDH